MQYTERTVIDKVEVVGEYRCVQVRKATVIERDGAEIARTYQREVIVPGDDVSAFADEVRAVCEAVHTQAVIDAYRAYLDEVAARHAKVDNAA